MRLDPDGEDLPYRLNPQMRALRAREPPELVPRPKSPQTTHPDPIALVNDQISVDKTSLPRIMTTTDGFLESVRLGYKDDPLFAKIKENPDHFSRFRWREGLLYMDRTEGLTVLCIPRTMHKLRKLTEIVIDQAHCTIGHAGNERTNKYVHKFYWWSTLSKDVAKFCMTCGTCQAIKPITQCLAGLLHPLPIPTRPWESIGMDFIGPLPPSPEGYNFIWVVSGPLHPTSSLVYESNCEQR